MDALLFCLTYCFLFYISLLMKWRKIDFQEVKRHVLNRTKNSYLGHSLPRISHLYQGIRFLMFTFMCWSIMTIKMNMSMLFSRPQTNHLSIIVKAMESTIRKNPRGCLMPYAIMHRRVQNIDPILACPHYKS